MIIMTFCVVLSFSIVSDIENTSSNLKLIEHERFTKNQLNAQ